MHVPWMQVSTELVEQVAPELEVRLDWSEAEAGWGLLKMVKSVLGRCPDHEPPSWNDVVKGPGAAKLLAKMAGYRGDPEAFVDVCCEAQPSPVLERVDGGIRLRGLDRYDPYWAKNHATEWREKWKPLIDARKAGRDRSKSAPKPDLNRTGSAPDPAPNRGESVSKPAPQIQMQREIQTQSQKEIQKQTKDEERHPTGAEVENEGGGPVVEPTDDDARPISDVIWEALQENRREKGLPLERERPQLFDDIAAAAAKEVGPVAFCRGHQRFLGDGSFHDSGWPTAVYIAPKVWRPRAHDRPDREFDRLTGATLYEKRGRSP